MNIERLALDAVAGNDADIGIDTLKCIHDDLLVLYTGLTNNSGAPSMHIIAGFVHQIISRIDLAVALAAQESEGK